MKEYIVLIAQDPWYEKNWSTQEIITQSVIEEAQFAGHHNIMG